MIKSRAINVPAADALGPHGTADNIEYHDNRAATHQRRKYTWLPAHHPTRVLTRHPIRVVAGQPLVTPPPITGGRNTS